ncbi:AbrB/MazE/SpoVT family DNA-binding domain-containing protein [Chitinimonas koreensis]|uniref:AbrB/MazE/SpoVT family DNA-binding domain-containing protein n=1 Tax=Chitinimonas koreensis TaxID=356302 RepID=UPI00042591F3|nr:AbrB/MazE/SpoVT family DNA-binding domain-containing protein [Chitinimonas koreensis]
MLTVKMSSKGQIVIPKSVREARHLESGAEFTLAVVGDELRLLPAPKFAASSIEQAAGALAHDGRDRLSDEQTERAIADLLGAEDEASKP